MQYKLAHKTDEMHSWPVLKVRNFIDVVLENYKRY